MFVDNSLHHQCHSDNKLCLLPDIESTQYPNMKVNEVVYPNCLIKKKQLILMDKLDRLGRQTDKNT